MDDTNTFGDYTFDDWVPDNVQKVIRSFWGCFGRTYKDWLEAYKHQDTRELCYHIYPRGFGMPPYGAMVYYYTGKIGSTTFDLIKGRYIHHWNNIGSIIDDQGVSHHVSTCDMWVRILTEEESKTLL